MKTIILGVGNKILGDDGVGIHVVDELKKHIDNKQITIDTATTGGMNLLELMLGYDKAIIIDAVKTENGKKGDVKKIPFTESSTVHSFNPHNLSLLEAVEMVKKLGETRIPNEIIIIGVLLDELPLEFKDKLSPKIAAAVPKAVELTLKEIKDQVKVEKGND